jgi:hypothetical protein
LASRVVETGASSADRGVSVLVRDLHTLKTFAGEDVFHVVVESARGRQEIEQFFIAATVLDGITGE